MSSNQARISLLVRPGATSSQVVNFIDGVLQVRVAAPPVSGKANKELIALLSKVLDVAKGSITIVKGHASRRKIITIDGLSQEDVSQRLAPKPSSSGDATTNSLFRHQQSRRD